jgi:hypothetical protein
MYIPSLTSTGDLIYLPNTAGSVTGNSDYLYNNPVLVVQILHDDYYKLWYNNRECLIQVYENGFTTVIDDVEFAFITEQKDPMLMKTNYYMCQSSQETVKPSKIRLSKSGNGLWLLSLYGKRFILEDLSELKNYNLD